MVELVPDWTHTIGYFGWATSLTAAYVNGACSTTTSYS